MEPSRPKSSDPLYVTTGVVLMIALILPLFFGLNDYWAGLAITTALLGAVVFFLGIFVALPKSCRRLGLGMLLSGAVLLLASFTLCSTGAFRI